MLVVIVWVVVVASIGIAIVVLLSIVACLRKAVACVIVMDTKSLGDPARHCVVVV